jgi:hypothetical protein
MTSEERKKYYFEYMEKRKQLVEEIKKLDDIWRDIITNPDMKKERAKPI